MDTPWTKEQLLDTMGRPLTQSLFLEFGYNTQYAIFTLNDDDKIYNDKTYYSLKKWYLDIGDPTEYEFAKKCLLGWRHWKRICENALFKNQYLEEWRDELEVLLRSEGILSVMSQSEDNFQAAKWLADKGWDKRGAGRPSKADKQREESIKNRLGDSLNAEVIRMENYTKNG